jgi:hypothetical protein
MNTTYILGSPIWDKTQLEGETYTLLSFLPLWKCKNKERGTHCGVSFSLWPILMQANISSYVILPKYHLGSTTFFLRKFLDIATFHKYPKENHSNIDMILKISWIFQWNSLSQ